MHQQSATSPLSLFARFASAPQVSPTTALAQLRESLRRDLTRLLNTRNAMTIDQFMADAPTPFNYGMPDTRRLSPQSAPDLQRWALVIMRAVALYEPRLIQLRVDVAPVASRPAAVQVTISAMAQLSGKLCQLDFDTALA